MEIYLKVKMNYINIYYISLNKQMSEIAIKNSLTIGEYIKETNYDIDKFIIDKFWNQMNDDMDIYMDNETLKWMGYDCKRIRDNKKYFNKLLQNFEEGKDYYIYNNTEYDNKCYRDLDIAIKKNYPEPETKRGNVNSRHTLIKPDTFREIMMMLKTKKAKDVRKYYLALENLIKQYSKYQTEFKGDQLEKSETLLIQSKNELTLSKNELTLSKNELVLSREELQAKQAQLQKAQKRTLMLNNFVTNIKQKTAEQYIYIATTKQYAANNHFKVGGSISLKTLQNRLSTYNTGRPDNDLYYYAYFAQVSNYKGLENRIKDILEDFQARKEKEMYIMHYDCIKSFIELLLENYNEELLTGILTKVEDNRLTERAIRAIWMKHYEISIIDKD